MRRTAQCKPPVVDGRFVVEGVIALHDRRVPGTKGNIDHLAVGPGGVYIVDAKRYEGKVERRDVGSFFRPDARLYVNQP